MSACVSAQLSSAYLSPTQRHRGEEIVLHSVHHTNNLLKDLFVALLIYNLNLLDKDTSLSTHALTNAYLLIIVTDYFPQTYMSCQNDLKI